MNKTKAVVQCGALAFILCGLFPPWLYTFNSSDRNDAASSERSVGFRFILNAPDPSDDRNGCGVRIDTVRLGIEWLCVLVATGAAWVLVAKPGRDETKG
jgi:hypothetical protein